MDDALKAIDAHSASFAGTQYPDPASVWPNSLVHGPLDPESS